MSSHINGNGTVNESNGVIQVSKFKPIRTGICHSQQMLKHWKPDNEFNLEKDQDDENEEPERPSRIARIMAQVSKEKLTAYLEHVKVRKATKEEIMLVHSEGHWDRIAETATMPLQDLKDRAAYYSRLSLYVNADTFDCARLSCGGVIEMCRAVVEGRIKNGFAVVRPPGHHSEPEDPCGFCVFNNVAITAKWVLTVYPEKIKKILVVDWDVHHGNGTQRSFYYDANVLYISIHRFLENNRTSYFYPGSDWGGSTRVGEGAGRGFNVNIPWPEGGMGDPDYIYTFQRLVMPIAMEFNPDFVIVSAGFDAAKFDPLGECDVTPEGFAHMTYMLSSLANGNLVLALEGGYHLEAIALSATECIKVLMGEAPPKLGSALVASDVATETVDECLKIQSEFWKSLPRAIASKNELQADGLSIPIGDVLKMHRSYDLYKTHGLCSIPLQDSHSIALSKGYQNQILVSENVYESSTLVLFMHDLGSIRNEIFVEPTNLNDENEALLHTNHRLMQWIRKHDYGIIDVQVLPSYLSDLAADGLAKRVEKKRTIGRLVNWLWNQFITLSDCQNLVLILLGEGCSVLRNVIGFKDITSKLKASVSIPNVRHIPVKLESDFDWFHDISAAFIPSESDQGLKSFIHKPPYGMVKASDKLRPSQILNSDWNSISEFIESKLSATKKSQDNDATMDIDELNQ
ncbi:hypothetical protein O181_000684 [Austropuccinia psidii MF-1]|uniref:histone deacetylase n=1 Tax=Austropuccinia psidii MF-1 TaxID=1389203 RepID=A0A9Q3B900_9BASI|nr:hypothetical protein [Austropuccinia psidii MF-1]